MQNKKPDYSGKMIKFYQDIKVIIGSEKLLYNEVLEIFKIGHEIYKHKRPFIDAIITKITESKTDKPEQKPNEPKK
jgi:hypothetical protein